MRNRVLLYAAIYGCIGVTVGVLLALYTGTSGVPHKNIILKAKSNGSAVAHDSAPVEPSKVEETTE